MQDKKELGHGPWFIALIFNESEKRYEFAIHTYAYRIAWIKGENWINAQLLGPFDSIEQAQYVYEEWKEKGDKNKDKLLAMGIELSKKYNGLNIWTDWSPSVCKLEEKETIKSLREKNKKKKK